jgi:cardiolipin synthase
VGEEPGGGSVTGKATGDKVRRRIRTKVEEKLRPLTLPNFITLFRMGMVPFFVLAVNEHDFKLALLIFVVAGATDALDGWLARTLHSESVIGEYLDPIADKLLLTVVYISLAVPQGQEVVIPLWLAILALFRDFLIMLVSLILYVVEDIQRFPPSVLGKATTFAHVITVCVVLLANLTELPGWIPSVCFYLSFGLVILSGFHYIYRSSRFIEAAREDRNGSSPDASD